MRAIVTVKSFTMPGMAERILVNNVASLDGEVLLVDAQTGKKVLFYPGRAEGAVLTGGLAAPIEAGLGVDKPDQSWQLAFDFAARYRDWLLKN